MLLLLLTANFPTIDLHTAMILVHCLLGLGTHPLPAMPRSIPWTEPVLPGFTYLWRRRGRRTVLGVIVLPLPGHLPFLIPGGFPYLCLLTPFLPRLFLHPHHYPYLWRRKGGQAFYFFQDGGGRRTGWRTGWNLPHHTPTTTWKRGGETYV